MNSNHSTGAGQQVSRKIGVITATGIVVANMIGAGIFTTSGIMTSKLPDSGWVILCWIFGGMIAICGSLCYAELATRMPRQGGEYLYLKKLYHPLLGFLTGWTSFIVGFSVPIAASGIGFSSYLYSGLEESLPALDATTSSIIQKAVAIVIILAFTGLHFMGVRLGGMVQNVLTVIKILLVLGLALLGVIFGSGDWSNISFKTVGPVEGLAIGTAMMFVMFAYSGWNASAYIAGELINPRKSLPISLLTGTTIVIILYLLINLFYFHAVPYSELQGVITIAEKASVHDFGEWMGNGLGILTSLALLSSLSAFVIIGPRVYHAMACDGLFFRFAAQVHPRFGVPGRSIVIQGGLAIVMVLVGSFEQLLTYLGFALSIFPWLAVVGLFLARKRGIGESTAFKVWGYPFTPLFFLAASLGLMIVAFVNRPQESSIAIATVLLGIPCYYISVARFDKRPAP